MKGRRRIIQLSVFRAGEGASARFFGSHTLPLGSADVATSETCACLILKAVNAQLDFAESKHRLAMVDFDGNVVGFAAAGASP